MKRSHYRKPAKKRKGEIAYARFLQCCKWALILFGCYVVANVSFKFLWNHFHLDGSLPVVDGRVVCEENWLVRNHRSSANPKCFQYAVVDTPEGYDRLDETLCADPNETDFLFAAQEPSSAADQIYIATTALSYIDAAEDALIRLKGLYPQADFSDISSERFEGKDFCYFSYQYVDDGLAYSALNAYFDTGTHSVLISIADSSSADLRDALTVCIESVRFTR